MKMIEASILMPMTILLTLAMIVLSIDIYISLDRQVNCHKLEISNSYQMSLSRTVDIYDSF